MLIAFSTETTGDRAIAGSAGRAGNVLFHGRDKFSKTMDDKKYLRIPYTVFYSRFTAGEMQIIYRQTFKTDTACVPLKRDEKYACFAQNLRVLHANAIPLYFSQAIHGGLLVQEGSAFSMESKIIESGPQSATDWPDCLYT